MKYFKSLIIIVLLFACNMAKGQSEASILDRIDFNDTTMINNDLMWKTIAEYITTEQNKSASDKKMYDVILAADNVLSRSCTSFTMYLAVYEYLINGFSQIGANAVVDYMMRLPYFNYVDADERQYEEIKSVAYKYERVKVGGKINDIQLKTINNIEFTLSEIKAKNIVVFFWSYSCPHCCDMIKELGDLSVNDKELAIVTVNVSGELRQVKKLLRKSNLDKAYNICDGIGWNSPIVDAYAVDMTPALFLLDENLVILAKPFDIEELKTAIE